MQNDIQRQILDAFLLALRPVAKIFFRFGMGFKEFSDIAKTAFVDVATSDYGLRGRPTNISRVAVMTGLTRKEVRRVREKIAGGDLTVVVNSTPLSEILHRWHAENEFLNSAGRPAVLPFHGEEVSFSSLVKKFGGDIPPGAMRTELKRVGAVIEDEQGNLHAVSRVVHPTGEHEALVKRKSVAGTTRPVPGSNSTQVTDRHSETGCALPASRRHPICSCCRCRRR